MEKAVPIHTNAGVLRGRDCIYFDSVTQDDMDQMIFTGELNGALTCQPNKQKDWLPYKLIFQRVLACFSCELDTYENLATTGYLNDSSFDWIENSTWLEALPIRRDFPKEQYKHYRLFTYDVVYNIIAVSHQMEIST